MTARLFADTNIVLYTIGKDPVKRDIARRIIFSRPVVSTQVINECVSVCLRKLSFTREQAYAFAQTVMEHADVLPVDRPAIEVAGSVAVRYQLSHWDSLIIASALLAGCETLYSEDLQHNLVIESRLRIVNPFAT